MFRSRILRNPKPNPFNEKFLATLKADGGKEAKYYKINEIDPARYNSLPFSIRILLESAVRNCDEFDITSKNVETILDWEKNATKQVEVPFKPARVILQDFTGVPCVVDLAAMRDAMKNLGGEPSKINPQIPVDLVVDHSVQADAFGTPNAAQENADIEMKRNFERFRFMKWGSQAFENLKIVPPGSGIVHQINLEYLARVVFNNEYLYPDSVVGTDSHTTMVDGLGVAGWGVGGIEAEAAMLGQSLSLVLPKVVGYKLTGKLPEGTTATDLVLKVVRDLRKLGVVGKFVEFYGPGVDHLSLADRATIANMAPEYGATMGFFAVDQETINYLKTTGRSQDHLDRIANYSKQVGLFRTGDEKLSFTEHISLDLSTVEPCVSGPKRPQDYVAVKDLKQDFNACMGAPQGFKGFGIAGEKHGETYKYQHNGTENTMSHGDVVIAAITSCTNTSNPSVLMAAGLLAKKAVEKGLTVNPRCKTTLSPGSHVVTQYLNNAGLQSSLDKLGFTTAGYGCMTCIGNSGELSSPELHKVTAENNIAACAVLSGNRNFEARVHPLTQGNYLMSPPLVVAYALAGNVKIDFEKEPIANGVFLKDIWPSNEEVAEAVAKYVTPEAFSSVYEDISKLNPQWSSLEAGEGSIYKWEDSTYIHNPPYFQGMKKEPSAATQVKGARCLLSFGDSITTDHISPAGNIALGSPAAKFLEKAGIERKDFNTYGSRRGNDEIMVRGTFANVRLPNKLVGKGTTGPKTIHYPTGEVMPIFDAAMKYKEAGTPTIVLAGKEYGSGSSRDWAAKGPYLQGIKVVIAESFERIHRSNLVGMGIVPLQFKDGANADSLGLTGEETFDFDFSGDLKPGQDVTVKANGKDITCTLRIDTAVELKFFENGGILNYVLRNKATA